MIIIICCLYCEHKKFISSYWTINIFKQVNLSYINRVKRLFIVYNLRIILSCQRYWNFQPDVVIKVCHTYDPTNPCTVKDRQIGVDVQCQYACVIANSNPILEGQ